MHPDSVPAWSPSWRSGRPRLLATGAAGSRRSELWGELRVDGALAPRVSLSLVAPVGRIDGRGTDGSVYYGRIAPAWRDVDLYDLSLEACFAGESQPWLFEGVAIVRGDGSLLFTLHGDRNGWFGSTCWSDVMRR